MVSGPVCLVAWWCHMVVECDIAIGWLCARLNVRLVHCLCDWLDVRLIHYAIGWLLVR